MHRRGSQQICRRRVSSRQHLELLAAESARVPRAHHVLDLQGNAVLVGKVELLLLGAHLGHDHALGLLGKLCQDLGLEAPKHEGADGALQEPLAIGLPRLHGTLVALGKLVVSAQIAGHEEVEDAPELRQAVLYGRAREGQADVGVKALDGPRDLGHGVLDVLRLVEYHAREVQRRVLLNVSAQEVVGGHQDVRALVPADEDAPGRPWCLARPRLQGLARSWEISGSSSW